MKKTLRFIWNIIRYPIVIVCVLAAIICIMPAVILDGGARRTLLDALNKEGKTEEVYADNTEDREEA